MSRRIALTILLTVWLAIVAGGVSAWLAARSILLSELDASIKRRAMTLPAVTTRGGGPALVPGDRAVIQVGNKTEDRVLASLSGTLPQPQVEAADFVRLPEGRFRRLTLRFEGADGGAPLTIVYSAAADGYDSVLTRLAVALSALGVIAGAVAAFAAARLARLVLRPLKATADTIGAIDEAKLDRRIDGAALPPELRPMAGRLNEMLQRLQSAFEQRRRFLADASHELRTPVAAMITSMEVALRRPRESGELRATLDTCLGEARHLQALVQALLRQVKAENSPDDESERRLDAAELTSQCADLAQPMAAERQIRLTRSIQAPISVKADPARLRSVLLNLVGNAIEYNRAGGSVDIAARADNGCVEFAVTDTGPGIDPEHLPHLFQPFYRASSDRESDGHLGLGLFLVDSHVKAMGGECRVESTVGSGTTFRIRLPAAANHSKGEDNA